jgi:F0F1-type ATP synthase membrane subunit b/b'
MKCSGESLRGGFAALLTLVLAGLTQAAEESGSAGHVMGTGGFKWVHFAIVAAVAFWLFTKVLPPAFRHRADHISAAISKAALAKAEAEKQLQEAVAKLASLEQEMEVFRAQAKKDGIAERDRLRTMAKADAEKIGFAAKAEIEAAEHAARVELKELAAKLAMDRAEGLVAKELTPAVQEAMLNEFVQSLQGRPN